MTELPRSIQKAALRYERIETDGLKLYPVLVRDYELFLMARPALEVMQQSLPVAMMRVPLLSALYQMDYEAILGGMQPSGLFSRALLLLALSLRLGEGQEAEERMKAFRVAVDRENPAKLLCIRYSDEAGEEKEITPALYGRLRQIIAAQNGVRLESDMANPALVKAEKDAASASAVELEDSIEDLISAVAVLSGVDESDVDEWPILKLQRRAESLRRILDYLVCGFGEVNGTTWKGGNPTPHPLLPRKRTGSGILTALGGSVDARGKTEPPKAAQEIAENTKNL